MVKVLDSYSMDFTMRIQFAQREDGQWFRRAQFRDARYGYKWSAWKAVAAGPHTFSVSSQRARLPRVA